ncbi:hypothetical protein Pflav_036980 [Phytohabitans flavus]|uniref:Uncharacterized protein n=1 Tax=Phytohabitans flavus TaxID=1076124 RepID=A0A6F8XU72_9ACTN|nr:hypothetical protein Pflav_036980 [Phytohabitans flavus]
MQTHPDDLGDHVLRRIGAAGRPTVHLAGDPHPLAVDFRRGERGRPVDFRAFFQEPGPAAAPVERDFPDRDTEGRLLPRPPDLSAYQPLELVVRAQGIDEVLCISFARTVALLDLPHGVRLRSENEPPCGDQHRRRITRNGLDTQGHGDTFVAGRGGSGGPPSTRS